MRHRSVIAEIGDARHRVFRDDHRIRDIRSSVGVEVADHRQLREIDGVAFGDLVEHRAARYEGRRDRRVCALLISVEEPARVHVEQTTDALARCEEVGRERNADAVHVLANDHRMLPARGELRDDRGHVLIGGQGFA